MTTSAVWSPCGANRKRIRTAQLGNRDERAQLLPTDFKLPVSGSDAKRSLCQTPRNCGNHSGSRQVRVQNLCNRRLVGGGRSLSRTRLWTEIPDPPGKCREVVQIPASCEASVSDPVPLDVLAGEFPTFGNREISASEHGFPPGRRAVRSHSFLHPSAYWGMKVIVSLSRLIVEVDWYCSLTFT